MESYRLENLTFQYPNREHPALDCVNLSVAQGEFVVLCGVSGCGKTTLLRHLKPSLTPHGVTSGTVFFEDAPISELSARDRSAKIGFVMQSPENQLVTDKVWHELAFGLESLGYDTATIRLRVAEMASFFGIQTWFHKDVTELSGGQKQLLNLASVMAMQPSVLILDEPTSQLDPIAASEFLATVGKINRELGVTVIMTEHRLEEVFPLADRAVVLDGGRVLFTGAPRDVGMQLRGHPMFYAMPSPMRIWAAVGGGDCPVTVRDGARWLRQLTMDNGQWTIGDVGNGIGNAGAKHEAPAVELSDVWFKYGRDLPDVVKGLSFKAYPGEITAVLGGNGTGKTTALSLMSGLRLPYRGKVRVNGTEIGKISAPYDGLLGVLPQNPQTMFVKKTVREDLLEVLDESKLSRAEKESRLDATVQLCRLSDLLDAHPYDLSGGEQQRAALAKVLLLQPKILLLDEPTKGFDAEFKIVFAQILRRLTAHGAAVVLVSHDVEFCAEYADRCALFFDGNVVSEGTPHAFFSGNSFYTTSANRMARGVLPDAVTAADVVAVLGGDVASLTSETDIPPDDEPPSGTPAPITEPQKKKLSFRRKLAAALTGACFLATVILAAINFDGLRAFVSGGGEAIGAAAGNVWLYAGILCAFAAEMVAFSLALQYKRDDALIVPRKLTRRTILAACIALLLIPLTIYFGYRFFGARKYLIVSLLIVVETMVPFAVIFESRKPQARELVIIASMCALAVAGRTAFFMVPQFKPVIALVIITGVAFGGETGFLVGAMTAFVSNLFFGQGPWTPWQMLSFGLIGFLAGVLFRRGLLRRGRFSLALYGALSTLVLFGGIMNPANVLIYQQSPNAAMMLASYLQGLPFDLVHAAATVVFMLVISRAMLEKLDRIKVKYGLAE